jgi:hypothetical protein
MDETATSDREELERRHTEEIARANAAIAAAQDRSYWLDRWNVDLNALMRRRGASELRAGLRAARAVFRVLYDLRNKLIAGVRYAPTGVARAKRVVEAERELAQPTKQDVRGSLEAAGVEPRPDDVWIAVQQPSQLDELPAAPRVVLQAEGVSASAVLARCTPAWRVALYLSGEPDVYVLERR